MSKVVRQDIDNLNAVLHITIEAADYSTKLEEELQKYRKKAQLKGFRAGKAPMALIKKMYGRAFVAELVDNLLQETLSNYIQTEKLDLLGQPLSNAEQEDINFDLKELHDFNFKLDIGLAPEFEIQGLDASTVFEQQVVEVAPERIQEEIDHILKEYPSQVDAEGDLQEGDLLQFTAVELEAGDTVKEGGVQSTFSVLFQDATPALQDALKANGIGAAFVHDIYAVEKDRDEAFVRRYLLNLETEDSREIHAHFQLTLNSAKRKGSVEMNQEFFDAVFGLDEVHNEEEMHDRIRKVLESRYEGQSNALLFLKFQNYLLETNELPLPDAFLKRWILETNDKANELVIEKEYPLFVKNLQWTLVRSKLAKHYGISVTEEEIMEAFKDQVRGYFAGYSSEMLGDDFLQNMAARLMQDEKQVNKMYEDILMDKLHVAIKNTVTIQQAPVSEEAFKQLFDSASKQASAERTVLAPDDEEE